MLNFGSSLFTQKFRLLSWDKSNLSVPWDLYTMHRNLAAARSSLLLTYTEQCLWDSSWHSHKGQDLGLIKQLRLLWQHIPASVVSLWIFLFSNCFFSTRCWPWLPHSAPATGFSYLLVSHDFALGNWPELFSSPQPLSLRYSGRYLMIPDNDWVYALWLDWTFIFCCSCRVGLGMVSLWPTHSLEWYFLALSGLWCFSSGCSLFLFPGYFVGRKDRPVEELSLWNISVFWMASLCQLISSN